MVSKEFIRQLEGYGLTTATILYRLPDHPKLLQTYIWQEYDLAPKFPVLHDFLDVLGAGARGAAPLGDGRPFAPDQAGRVQDGRRGADAALTVRGRRSGGPEAAWP